MRTNPLGKSKLGSLASQPLPFALLCAWTLFCSGCFTRRPPTAVMGPVVLAHPITPQPVAYASDDAPEIAIDIPRAPLLVAPRPAPPRPRVPSQPPAAEHASAGKPAEPTLAPELSDDQLAAAKVETERSLIVAERNLNLTQGHSLNPGQQDLVSKIRGFVDGAHDAIKEGDWQRAQSLARKAEILSHEFAPNP
jgi:hypothetical protein